MTILKSPHPALSKISDSVTEFNQQLFTEIEELYNTIAALPPETVAGMAAPQIGLNKRFFFALGKLFINPKISLANGRSLRVEGCFSHPDGPSAQFKVWRRDTVWIDYLDASKHLHHERYNGYMAQVIQHEFDHLGGIMCHDRSLASPTNKN